MAIIFIRTIIVFASLVIAMRLMGKRQLGELELSELVTAVLISDMASHPLQDIGTPLLNGLISVVTLLCCELLISAGILKSQRFRTLLCGKPSMLIVNGRVCEKAMRQNRFTLDELAEELRNQGVTDMSTIKYAILETDGTLNTIPYPTERPVTAAQMNISVPDNGFPTVVINDGRVLSGNLRSVGRDEKWLDKELRKRKVRSASDVYLMTIDETDGVYFVEKEGKG